MKQPAQKKILMLLVSLIIILTSCKDSLKNYVSVYEFMVMDNYYVKDSTKNKTSLIKLKKLHPIKIDLYMIGDELKGTLTRTSFQQVFGKIIVDNVSEVKYELKNIHLVKDELIMELMTPKKTLELKLIKSGQESFIIIPSSGIEKETEICNKFAKSGSNTVQYKTLSGNEGDLVSIKESNECAAGIKPFIDKVNNNKK